MYFPSLRFFRSGRRRGVTKPVLQPVASHLEKSLLNTDQRPFGNGTSCSASGRSMNFTTGKSMLIRGDNSAGSEEPGQKCRLRLEANYLLDISP